MSIWTKGRYRIHAANQHPYRHTLSEFSYTNPRLPSGVSNAEDLFDYIVAVLYPKYIGTYDDMADLLATVLAPTANDYAIIDDDGDGKSAGYVYSIIDGVSQWIKRYDVDWSAENIYAEAVNRTQYMYVHKYGFEDHDAAGVALTGLDAGQHIYGGELASSNLILHANSGDTLGAHTGNIVADDDLIPSTDSQRLLGSNAIRWLAVYSDTLFAGTLSATSGSITDSSGTISFDNEHLVTTGNLNAANGVFSGTATIQADMVIGTGSITSVSGAISFGNENLTTTGTLASGVHTVSGDMVIAAGSITSVTGAISFSNENLTTTGTFNAGAGTFTSVVVDNITIDLNTITTTSGNLNLTATGIVNVGTAMTTLAVTTTGTLAVTGIITIDNLKLDANTLSSTNANGDLLLSPNGTGEIGVTSHLRPEANAALDLGSAASGSRVWRDLFLSGKISNVTNDFTVADLMKLRSVNFRDSTRLLPAQSGDSLFFDGTQWLASAPDTEIHHELISGLTTTDAGHTQFVMLAGRAGGQTIQGGTVASENLTLDSTAHATKGLIRVSQTVIPVTTASYSGGWSGSDFGDSTHYYRDVYTKGEHKGFRFENLSPPANSAQNIGRAVYNSEIISVDTGAAWVQAVMTTQAQTIAGVKTFSNNIIANASIGIGVTPSVALDVSGAIATRKTDVATAATIASLATTTGFVKLTGSTATSVQGIAGGFNGKEVFVYNGSSAIVTFPTGLASAGEGINATQFALSPGEGRKFVYDSTAAQWAVASSPSTGGGGGGGIVWQTWGSASFPPPGEGEALGAQHFLFQTASLGAQYLWTVIKVPRSYVAGTRIYVYVSLYSTTGAGANFLIRGEADLMTPGADPISGGTLRTTTNSAINTSASNFIEEAILDVTDSAGLVGGTAVAAGDIIRVKLYRDTDTDTGDVRVLKSGSDVKFS